MSMRLAAAIAVAAAARASRSSCWAVSSTALASAKETLAMMSSMLSLALMSVVLAVLARGWADSSARASRSWGYPGSPRRLQKRSTVVSDVWAATASSLMVSAAAARASASTCSATRSSAGESEGRRPRSRTSSGAGTARVGAGGGGGGGGGGGRGAAAGLSARGMSLRYGLPGDGRPAFHREGLRRPLAVEQDPAGALDQDAVDEHTAAEVAAVGRVPPAQQ